MSADRSETDWDRLNDPVIMSTRKHNVEAGPPRQIYSIGTTLVNALCYNHKGKKCEKTPDNKIRQRLRRDKQETRRKENNVQMIEQWK